MDNIVLNEWINEVLASSAFIYSFGVGTIWGIVIIALTILMIVSRWRIFEKAWQPWWGILIPIYNIYLTFKVAWRPGRWTRWILFPPVLIILLIITCFDIPKRFWKPAIFGLWILFLKYIVVPILAFDKNAKWTPKEK